MSAFPDFQGPRLIEERERERTPAPPWPARAKEFCAGGIRVFTVAVLEADQADGAGA